MNDALATKLAEVIGGIQASVAKASDFAVEQLPDIAQQYLTYGRFTHTIMLVAGVVAVVVGLVSMLYCVRKGTAAEYGKEGPYVIGGILSAISMLVGGAVSMASFSPFAMVWFAPKIYLIQGLAGLLK